MVTMSTRREFLTYAAQEHGLVLCERDAQGLFEAGAVVDRVLWTFVLEQASADKYRAEHPTDWVMLVPKTAYSNGGRMLAYRPATGGRPATRAYAMPCGTIIMATTMPALISPGSRERW